MLPQEPERRRPWYTAGKGGEGSNPELQPPRVLLSPSTITLIIISFEPNRTKKESSPSLLFLVPLLVPLCSHSVRRVCTGRDEGYVQCWYELVIEQLEARIEVLLTSYFSYRDLERRRSTD